MANNKSAVQSQKPSEDNKNTKPKVPSAIKRQRQSKKRMLRNRINKTKVHNAVKKVRTDLAESPELAQKSLKSAMSVIHKAATKGTLHKKTAARRISRLASSIHKASLRLDAASTPSGEYVSENAPDQPAGE